MESHLVATLNICVLGGPSLRNSWGPPWRAPETCQCLSCTEVSRHLKSSGCRRLLLHRELTLCYPFCLVLLAPLLKTITEIERPVQQQLLLRQQLQLRRQQQLQQEHQQQRHAAATPWASRGSRACCCVAISQSPLKAWRSSEASQWRSDWARALSRSSSKRGIILPSAFLLNTYKPVFCLYTSRQQQGSQQRLLVQRRQQQQRSPLHANALAGLRGLNGGARSSKRCGRASSSSSSSSGGSVRWHDLLGAPYTPITEGERQQLLLRQAELQQEDEAFAAALREAEDDSGDDATFFRQQQPQQQKQQQKQQRQQEDLEALQDMLAGVLGLLPNGASEAAALAELEALVPRPGSRRSTGGEGNLTSWLEAASALQGPRAQVPQEETDAADLFGRKLLEETGLPELLQSVHAAPQGVSAEAALTTALAAAAAKREKISSTTNQRLSSAIAATKSGRKGKHVESAAAVAIQEALIAAAAAAATKAAAPAAASAPAATAAAAAAVVASSSFVFAALLFCLCDQQQHLDGQVSDLLQEEPQQQQQQQQRPGRQQQQLLLLCFAVRRSRTPSTCVSAPQTTTAAAAAAAAAAASARGSRASAALQSFAEDKSSSHEGAAALLRHALQHPAVPSWLLLLQPQQQQQQLKQPQQHLQLQGPLQPEDTAFLSSLLSVGTAAAAFLVPKPLSSTISGSSSSRDNSSSNSKSSNSSSSNSSSNTSSSTLSIDWDGHDEALFSRLLQLKLLLLQQQQPLEGMQQHQQQLALARKPLVSIGSAAWARPLVEQYLYLRDQQQQQQQRQQQQQQQQQGEGTDGLRGNELSSQSSLSFPPLPSPAAFADRLLLFGHLLSEPSADGFAESRSSAAAAGVAAALGVGLSLCLGCSLLLVAFGSLHALLPLGWLAERALTSKNWASANIPLHLAEARLKCLLRRVVSSLTSRLFASVKPPTFPLADGAGAEELLHQQQQKHQQQQRKQQLLLGTEALQDAAAALGVEQSEVQAACAEALPLLLARLVALVEMFALASPSPQPLSSIGDPAFLGAPQQQQHGGPRHRGPQKLRQVSALRLVAGLLDAAEVVKIFASSLLSPEAAAKTPQQLTSLAVQRLLPAVASAALAELAASSARLHSLGLEQATSPLHGRSLRGGLVDFEASSAAEQEAPDAQSACFDVFAALRRGLQLGQKEFLSVVQIGVFRAGAPLRRALEGFAVMRNDEALIRVARQLLALDLQLERLVDAACEEAAPHQPQPLGRRRRSRQLQAGGIPVAPPSAGPSDLEEKRPLKELLMSYLRRHALLGESPSTAAAEALQEAEKSYREAGGPLVLEDKGAEQVAKGLLEGLVRAWDRVETTPDCDAQESLPKDATEYAYTLLLQQQQQQQQQQQRQQQHQQVDAPDLASRWRQLTSIGARQEEALKASQLRAVIAEKLAPSLRDLAKHCASPSQGGGSREETIPSRAENGPENGPWSRWLLRLRNLQTTEAADALALQIRDSLLMPLSGSFGLPEESQAVAAAVEVYRQVFDKETEAVSAEATHDTPATADARRRRLLGVRAALGLAASNVSSLHAEAYKEWFLAVAKEALASEGSWTAKAASKERWKLTQEALAIHAVESLLPAVLRAAAERREATLKKNEEQAASLPMPIKQVVGEEAVEEEALGPQPDDHHEPVLRHLKRALTRRHEGLRLLRAAAAADSNFHLQDTEDSPSDLHTAASNRLSLVGALGAPQQTRGDKARKEGAPAVPADAKSSPRPTGVEEASQQLLEALATLHAFGCGHNLLPQVERFKKAARELSERQQQMQHAKQGPHHHTAAALLSALRSSPPAQPLEAFVEAFTRQDSPQSHFSALGVALEEALEAALGLAAEAGRGPFAKGDKDSMGLAAALHALQCLHASAAAASAQEERRVARSSPLASAADQRAEAPSRGLTSLAALTKERGLQLMEIACLEGSRAVASALLAELGLVSPPAGIEGVEAIPSRSASRGLAAALQHVQQLLECYGLTDQDTLRAFSGSREDLIKNLALQLLFRTALKEAARRDRLAGEAEKRSEPPPAFPAWSPSRGMKAAAAALGVPAWHRRLRVDSQQLFELFRHEAGATVARALQVAAEGSRGGSRVRLAAFGAAADDLSTSRSLLDVSGFRATNALKEIFKKRLEAAKTALTSLLQGGDLPAAVESLSRVADVVLLSRALLRQPWWTASSSELEKMASSVFSDLKQHERRRLIDLCRAKPPTDPASLKEELQLLEKLLLPSAPS
ncbi:hypothetical protein ACSSS7_001650 [Eimeria intestinalis]